MSLERFVDWGIGLVSLRNFVLQHSLRYRLLLGAFIWLSMVLIAAGLFIPRVVHNYLYAQLTEQTELYLDEITAFVGLKADGQLSMKGLLSNPRFRKPYSGWYWQVETENSVLRSRSLWDARFDIGQGEEPDYQALIFNERQLSLGAGGAMIKATVAVDSQPTDETYDVLTGGMLIALAVVAFSSLLFIALQIRWSLRPMAMLKEDLQSVHDGRIDRLLGQYPKEVQPVVDDLNRLLFHYAELLERSRHHTGNLAHALKTPVAILVNEVATLPDSYRPAFLTAIEQLENRINYHLGRARMAGSARILAARSCPAAVVDAITLAFDKVYAHRHVVLVNELDDHVWVTVEERDLEEILGNVIENAFKWSAGLIRVHGVKQEHQLSIYIDDNGQGLTPEEMDKVMKRGVRMDEQVPGSGLGLDIVQEIAHSYQGSLALASSAMGGLQVQIVLPRSPG